MQEQQSKLLGGTMLIAGTSIECSHTRHAHFDRSFWLFWHCRHHDSLLAFYVLDCNAHFRSKACSLKMG